MKESKKIILVDICGTIFDSNTTFDFLDTMLTTSSYRRYRSISKTLFWRVFNKLCVVILGIDLTRKIAVRYLKGYTENELLLMSEKFYEVFLSKRYKYKVLDLIKSLQKNVDNRLILISATLDCIASVIARNLNIMDVISSELIYDKAQCTGKLKTDLLGNKLKELKLNGIIPLYEMMITNDYSDIDVILQSKKSCIVLDKNERKWNNLLNRYNYTDYFFIK